MSTKEEAIKEHDEAIREWIQGGEVLHVWRNWNDGFLVSYYITLFRQEDLDTISIDFARVFGNGSMSPMVSIDQRFEAEGSADCLSFSEARAWESEE